jgi:hypothetical protein
VLNGEQSLVSDVIRFLVDSTALKARFSYCFYTYLMLFWHLSLERTTFLSENDYWGLHGSFLSLVGYYLFALYIWNYSLLVSWCFSGVLFFKKDSSLIIYVVSTPFKAFCPFSSLSLIVCLLDIGPSLDPFGSFYVVIFWIEGTKAITSFSCGIK